MRKKTFMVESNSTLLLHQLSGWSASVKLADRKTLEYLDRIFQLGRQLAALAEVRSQAASRVSPLWAR